MARFLLLTHIYPPAVDGGSKVIAKMGDYLKSKGHEILVITSNCTSTDDFSKLNHRTIIHPKNVVSIPVLTIFHRPLKLLSKLFPNLKPFSKGPIFTSLPLLKIISFKPNFILAGPLPTSIILYARFLRYLTKSKLIINASFHPTDQDFQSPILLSTLKSADYIWTLTDNETDYFRKNLTISSIKLLNLGNGVDKNFLTKNTQIKSKNNLLYIGSFASHKNIITLIKAFSLLPDTFKLTLAGQKTLYFPELQKQILKLDSTISKRIKIIYSFKDSQLSKLLDSTSILISPSLQESFGLVLIEAMARSKPVIAANINSSKEIISKSQSGLLFDSLNPIDLKNKILSLSQNSILSKKYGNNGFDYVSKHYTWDKIGESICKKLGI